MAAFLVPHWACSYDTKTSYVCDAGNFPFNTADIIPEPGQPGMSRSVNASVIPLRTTGTFVSIYLTFEDEHVLPSFNSYM